MTDNEVGVLKALVKLVDYFKDDCDVKGLKLTCNYVSKAAHKIIKRYEKGSEDLPATLSPNGDNR